MRRITSLLSLAALTPASLCAQAALDLKFMTFNIRYASSAQDWNARRDLVIGVIRNHAPDVVGLQEALRGQLNDMRAGLPAYGELGVGRDDGKTAGEYSAILYKTGMWEVDTSGTYWLSPTPEVPGSRAPGALPRINTWARLRHKTTGRTLYFNNSHWDHASGSARMLAARLIAERIANQRHKGDPVVVTCDCNAFVSDSTVRYLLGFGGSPVSLTSAYHRIRPNDPQSATFHNFTGRTEGQPIDHILYSAGFGAQDAAILRDRSGTQYPSDHYPVAATLRLDATTALNRSQTIALRRREDRLRLRLLNGVVLREEPGGRHPSPLFHPLLP